MSHRPPMSNGAPGTLVQLVASTLAAEYTSKPCAEDGQNKRMLFPDRAAVRGGPTTRGGPNVTLAPLNADASELAATSATSRKTGLSPKLNEPEPVAEVATAKFRSRMESSPADIAVPVGSAMAIPILPTALKLVFTFNVAPDILPSLLALKNCRLAGSKDKVKASAFSLPVDSSHTGRAKVVPGSAFVSGIMSTRPDAA